MRGQSDSATCDVRQSISKACPPRRPCGGGTDARFKHVSGLASSALWTLRRHTFIGVAVGVLTAPWSAASQPILETVTSGERVSVHAELVVTRRLLHSTPVRLLEALPALGDIDGAMVVPHGPPVPVELGRGGIALEGVQQRFSVFPERSGLLVIPEATARISTRGEAPGGRGQMLRITAPSLAIDVAPMPESYPENSAWFPAQDVTLRDEWPAGDDFAVGKPIDRVLTVVARGAPASAIPPLIARSPEAFRSYPEPAQLDERADGVVIGERVERRTLIPTTAGAFAMPSVEVVWWNTRTDTLATTIAPVKRLSVAGPAVAANPEAPPVEDIRADSPVQSPGPASPSSSDAQGQSAVLAIVAAVGWSLALFLAVRQRRNRPHTTADTKPSARTAPSLQALLRRLRKRPPDEAKAAILDWLGASWDMNRVQALNRLQSTPTGRNLLDALNAPIYAQQPSQPKHLEPLLTAMLAQTEPPKSAADALPPLYPTNHHSPSA